MPPHPPPPPTPPQLLSQTPTRHRRHHRHRRRRRHRLGSGCCRPQGSTLPRRAVPAGTSSLLPHLRAPLCCSSCCRFPPWQKRRHKQKTKRAWRERTKQKRSVNGGKTQTGVRGNPKVVRAVTSSLALMTWIIRSWRRNMISLHEKKTQKKTHKNASGVSSLECLT